MNRKLRKNIFITFTFATLALTFILALERSKSFIMTADSSFQLSRANEIYQNLKHGGLFTFIATHCFSQSGVGTFLFYPSIFIYPLALLRFVFNPVTSIWIWIGLFLFLTLLISFYSMLSFSNGNYRRSYIFAIIYTVVPYHIYLGIWNGTYGEYIAYTFLPIVFLGIYEVLWRNVDRWYILTLGISLICYSHILSIYISIGLCFVLFMLKLLFSTINKKRFIGAVKAAVLTVILTGWQFIPFLTDYIGKGISAPNETFQFLYSFDDLINNSFSNTDGWRERMSIGVLLALIMLVGWSMKSIRENQKELVIYSLGTLILLCSSTFLAWQSFQSNKIVLHTLGNIQMTFRLLPYGCLLLSVTASFIVDNYINDFRFSNKNVSLLVGLFVMMSIGGYYGSIQNQLQVLYDPHHDMLQPSYCKSKQVINPNAVVSKQNYNNIFDYQILFGETDYYNEKAAKFSKSIINNWTYLGSRRKVIKKFPGVNTILMEFHSKDSSEVANLPIVAYHNTYVTNNGLSTKYKISQRGTVLIKLHKGVNKIVVSYRPSAVYYICFVVSIFGWFLFFKLFIKGVELK